MPIDKDGNYRIPTVPDFRIRYDSELGKAVRERYYPGTMQWVKVPDKGEEDEH